jgi:hypothetical protein
MAATQNIGLRITIGGVTESISNIKQLEDAITKARNKLSGLSIGSSEFKQLTNEINTAQSSLKDLNKAAEGLESGKKLEAFARVGGAITSSFAAAQAAVTLFGGDSEKVAEAASKAQNLLTIVLTARSVAEGVAGLRTVALTIATKASTLATNASTAATRVLYTTIAANPIGALVAVIGLAVGALIAFGSSSEEAADSQEELEKRLKLTNDQFSQQTTLLEIQGEKSSNLQRIKVQQAQENLEILQKQFVREQINNRNSEETAKLREQVRNQENVLILEKARLEKTINDETSAAEQKLADNRKKREDAANQRILDSIRLRGELRKIELDAITSGPGIESFGFKETDVEKQEQVLKKLSTTQSDYNDVVEKYNQLTRELPREGEGFQFVDIPQNVSNQIKLLSNLITQSFTLANLPANETTVRLRDLLKTQEGFLEGTYNNTQGYIQNQQELLKFERDFITQFVSEQIKGFTGNAEQTKLQREILAQQANVVFDNLIQNGKELNKVSAFIEGYTKRIDEVSKSNAKLAKSTEVVNGFIKENTELLVNSFDLPIKSIEETKVKIGELQNEIATQRFDDTKKFAGDILQLEKILKDEGIDITKASYEEKLELLKLFLEKEVEATETAEGKKRKAQEDTISGITATIQAFQSVLNSLAQTTSQYYAFQLDLLAKQSEDIQEKIVGDSKEAVDLRLEQEKIYNEKRKQLEKQAAITALRISFAQSLANTAEAITKAFAGGPIVGVVAAAFIATISAAQTALIGSQIAQINSLQRGGMIRKAQGGTVIGPSHEYGGVKFQGGGIELEGGEAVINRRSSIQYGGLLNQINQVGGGKPLTSNTFDDSRIVEAISKQRQEPIRAYVVEQDISNKQGVSRRLEQLSQI